MEREDQLRQLMALEDAISCEAYNLRHNPNGIWQQVYNRLSFSSNSNDNAIDMLKSRIIETKKTYAPGLWLELLNHAVEPDSLRFSISSSRRVLCCDIKEGGLFIAAGYEEDENEEGRIELYSSDKGKLYGILTGHKGAVLFCSFDSKGRKLVSSGSDGYVKLWDASAIRFIEDLGKHNGWATSCQISPDNKVASTGWDGSVFLWNSVDSCEKMELRGHNDSVACCDFNEDGSLLATGGWDKKVHIWNTSSGEIERELQLEEPILSCRFTGQNSLLMGGWKGHSFFLESIREDPSMRKVQRKGIVSIDISEDGRIVCGGWDNIIKTWMKDDPTNESTIHAHGGEITTCRLTSDILLSSSADGSVKTWSLEKVITSRSEELFFDPINICRFSPDSRRVIVCRERQRDSIEIWGCKEAKRIESVKDNGFIAKDMCFAPEGKLIAISANGFIKLIDMESMKEEEIEQIPGYAQPLTSCDISHDGYWMVATGISDILYVWRIDLKKFHQSVSLGSINYHTKQVVFMKYSYPDTAFLTAAGSSDVPEVRSSTLDIEIAGLKETEYSNMGIYNWGSWLRRICYSNQGRYLAGGCENGDLLIQDRQDMSIQRFSMPDKSQVNTCVWSPNDREVLFGTEDGRLGLLSLENGRMLAEFPALSSVTSCDYSSDGNYVCCGDRGGRFYIFRVGS